MKFITIVHLRSFFSSAPAKEETYFPCDVNVRAISSRHFCPPSPETFSAGATNESTGNTSVSPLVRIAFGSPKSSPKICGESIKQICLQLLLLPMTSEKSWRELCVHPLQLVVVKWNLGTTTLRQSNHLLLWTTMLRLGPGWFSWMHPNAPGSEETLHGSCVCVGMPYRANSTQQSVYHRDKPNQKTGLVMAFQRFVSRQRHLHWPHRPTLPYVKGISISSLVQLWKKRVQTMQCHAQSSFYHFTVSRFVLPAGTQKCLTLLWH